MKISVLTDNHAGLYTQAEHGLSYLIEFDGKRILFDTGMSDLFINNAKMMNVSLNNIDIIILSHGHLDHGNGLDFLSGGKLVCHPGCFVKRYRKSDHKYIGLKNSRDELSLIFDLFTTSEPLRISENIYFLGEIPRLTDFESKITHFVLEDGTPDFVTDDSALAMVLPNGIFVVTGCGHSGAVNTLEHARKVTSSEKISGIIGGLHLKEVNDQTLQTIKYLKDNSVEHVFPSHCTELPALAAFYNNFGMKQVKTGDILEF